MKITTKWLKERNASTQVIDRFSTRLIEKDALELLEEFIKLHCLIEANWIIVRIMNYCQRVLYACYAAKQALPIYEKKSKSKRPREAIEAALKCVENPSKENKEIATAFADNTTFATGTAAAFAANAAGNDNASDAECAFMSAWDTVSLDIYDHYNPDTYSAAAMAQIEIQRKILKYGISLLKEVK